MTNKKRKTKTDNNKRQIETYEHRNKERVNNPPVGLVTPETDPDAGQQRKTYAYDPHLDPQLIWARKAEGLSCKQERILAFYGTSEPLIYPALAMNSTAFFMQILR